jgi:hypothetical protein
MEGSPDLAAIQMDSLPWMEYRIPADGFRAAKLRKAEVFTTHLSERFATGQVPISLVTTVTDI